MSNLLEKLEDRIMPEPNSGCWIWLGDAISKGYGRFDGQMAHRVSYELHKGKIPTGLVLDHLCRNHMCVNPDHLEAVTRRENTIRGIGPTALNAQKTHCNNGHPLDAANTRFQAREGGVRRACKTCQLESMRRYRSRAALSRKG